MGLTATIAIVSATVAYSCFAVITLFFAALHDVVFRTVPNWTSVVLVLVGILLQILSGTLMLGLLAGALVFLGAAFCWHRGWLGGGDVKLLAAVTVLVPPTLTLNLLLDIALAGGILALLYLLLARLVTRPLIVPRQPGLLRRIWRAELYRIHRGGPLPYALAIATGAFLVLLKG